MFADELHGHESSHRESGYAAVLFGPVGVVVLFDVGDYAVEQVVAELVARGELGVLEVEDEFFGQGGFAGRQLVGIDVGGDHDHGLAELPLDHVVHDLAESSEGGPGFFVSSAAVQQVEDGVGLALVGGVVAVWQVD